MTKRYANNFVGVLDGTQVPASLGDGRRIGANVQVISAVITMAAQPADADGIVIGKRPAGSTFLGVELCTDTSTGAATVAVGIAGAAAKYKTAAAFTTLNTPTRFGVPAAMAADPTSDEEELILTVAAAALPGAGTLVVNFLYASSVR